MRGAISNADVAVRLDEAADLLGGQGANPFRVGAYRRAAEAIRGLAQPVVEVFARGGSAALLEVPHVGRGIAAAIAEMLVTGRWGALERMRGDADPIAVLRSVPGIGPILAQRIHDALHVETLETFEAAAVDGRLAAVPGIGPRRAAAVRASLAAMLGPVGRRALPRVPAADAPAVATLLALDAEYRSAAARGALPTIAPRRMNPSGAAWLPVMHVSRNGRHYTALYSNSPRAHALGRVHDWVILAWHDGDDVEGQCTVVTETRGALAGRRVVRGRETDCGTHYGQCGTRARPP